MRIGILTYPLNNNYGCYLQSYALLHYLLSKGYDAEYIYRRHNKPSLYFYLRHALSAFLGNVTQLKWTSLLYDFEDDYMLKKGQMLYPFFLKNICSDKKPIYTTSRLKKKCLKFDAIIVGSDQVWRADILSNIEDYYLTFLRDSNVRRIAYAASFGKEDPGYTDKQKQICGEALGKFCAVSVREDVGKEIIKNYGWIVKSCEVVLDPTMLLGKDEYATFIDERKAQETVFGYILDQTRYKSEMLNFISSVFNLDSCNFLEGSNTDGFIYPPIEKWLGEMSNSRFVLTDSFHGVVFSIIFNKPFAVIINEGRGAARFNTLLNTFGLTDRIIKDQNDLVRVLKQEIDWNKVNETLYMKRKEAESFLKKGIESKS